MAPSRRLMNSWAVISWSSARTSTKPSSGPPASQRQHMARSRSVRSGDSNCGCRSRMTVAAEIERTFREEHGRVLAALIGRLDDFTLAEDALQDALVVALERWEREGVPR